MNFTKFLHVSFTVLDLPSWIFLVLKLLAIKMSKRTIKPDKNVQKRDLKSKRHKNSILVSISRNTAKKYYYCPVFPVFQTHPRHFYAQNQFPRVCDGSGLSPLPSLKQQQLTALQPLLSNLYNSVS